MSGNFDQRGYRRGDFQRALDIDIDARAGHTRYGRFAATRLMHIDARRASMERSRSPLIAARHTL